MKLFVVALALFSVASAALTQDQAWEEFKLQFKKGYKSLVDETVRKQIFVNNLEEVEKHNAKFDLGLSSYRQGINFYSDWTWEEFKDTVLMNEISELEMAQHTLGKPQLHQTKKSAAPSSADWRSIMNPVKNQGSCGSCWAFGAIGAMEAAWNMAGNGKVVLGEQMLVDCSVGDCNGGWVDRALDHIINVGGAPMESDYPYTARNGNCHYTNSMSAASISSYKYINAKTQGIDHLADSIATNGPHAIYLYANSAFQRYSSGIFDDSSCSKYSYNHAVINVGYDMNEGYWLVRNSWSASWGEAGHIKMKMGSNICNSEHYAWIPFV